MAAFTGYSSIQNLRVNVETDMSQLVIKVNDKDAYQFHHGLASRLYSLVGDQVEEYFVTRGGLTARYHRRKKNAPSPPSIVDVSGQTYALTWSFDL